MITPEGITVWAGLAFVPSRSRCTTPFDVSALHGSPWVAVLSWLVAGAALSMMTPLLNWLDSHL
jgi:hypothetical protein